MLDSYGRRLLASLVDYHAQNDPHGVWASFPICDDRKAGFRDVTYKELAEAIARAAWWLDQTLDASDGTFETFAYSGDKDIRYPILAVAAVKVERKILVPSPFTTREAQLYLLIWTECRTYLYTDSFGAATKDLLKDVPNMQSYCIPEAEVWLDGSPAAPYAYNKTWEDGFQDPWIIFHTSGTTGLPKPTVYTNESMVTLDAAKVMPDAHEQTFSDQYSDGRWHSPVPSLHVRSRKHGHSKAEANTQL
ncbi:MAG: hypothetical protein L6R37_008075 [Teloschistes peruensis]|nr:MAG: hypothetical protein L6R37_008075 [Teloschistes peruensis]